MISRSQLKFHETFQPETNYIAKILELASLNYSGDKFEISEKTGIPTGKQKGKVEPHIKYASYMGLISYVYEKGLYQIKLTSLGTEVYEQDPYLHENLSKWICHYCISRKHEGAPQWSFVVNESHPGFVQPISFDRLLDKSGSTFGVSATFEEIFGVMKRSYIEGFFSSLDYLEVDDKHGEFRFNEMADKSELLFVYAYALLNNWDNIFVDKAEITIIELIEELSFGKIFGLSDDSISEVLNELSDEGILSINRQMFPMTIIRTSTVDAIIPKLYSLLL